MPTERNPKRVRTFHSGGQTILLTEIQDVHGDSTWKAISIQLVESNTGMAQDFTLFLQTSHEYHSGIAYPPTPPSPLDELTELCVGEPPPLGAPQSDDTLFGAVPF